MTEAVPVTPAAIRALAARYKFQSDRFNKAVEDNNEKVMDVALHAMEKIEAEATAIGQTIEQIQQAPVLAGTVVTNNKITPTNPVVGKSKSTSTVPKSVSDKEKVAARAKAIAAEKVALGQAPGAAKVRIAKPKAAPVMRPCLDGCGIMVGGNFKMGHDAKLKSLILKVERGEEDKSAIPEIAQGLIVFKKGEKVVNRSADGKKVLSEVQEWECTAAPVRFPGRDGMRLTVRE